MHCVHQSAAAPSAVEPHIHQPVVSVGNTEPRAVFLTVAVAGQPEHRIVVIDRCDTFLKRFAWLSTVFLMRSIYPISSTRARAFWRVFTPI